MSDFDLNTQKKQLPFIHSPSHRLSNFGQINRRLSEVLRNSFIIRTDKFNFGQTSIFMLV